MSISVCFIYLSVYIGLQEYYRVLCYLGHSLFIFSMPACLSKIILCMLYAVCCLSKALSTRNTAVQLYTYAAYAAMHMHTAY